MIGEAIRLKKSKTLKTRIHKISIMRKNRRTDSCADEEQPIYSWHTALLTATADRALSGAWT